MKYSRHSRGFTLVEVLVAIVILCVGLLGVVGMLAAALKSNKEARVQSLGVQYARELAEMIRGNKTIGNLTSNNPYVGQFQVITGGASSLVAPTPSYCLSVNATTACASNTEVAQAELTEWLARVAADLPSARVDICWDSTPFDSNGIPQWACTAATGAPMVIKIGWNRTALDKTLTGSAAIDTATVPAVILPLSP